MSRGHGRNVALDALKEALFGIDFLCDRDVVHRQYCDNVEPVLLLLVRRQSMAFGQSLSAGVRVTAGSLGR